MNKLFGLSDLAKQKDIKVILIQIDEAHSSEWPVALEKQPSPQRSLSDRLSRANYFIKQYNPPYQVCVDGWDNQFAELYRAWPDKYHLIDQNRILISKSEYGLYGNQEALIIEDCTELIEKL